MEAGCEGTRTFNRRQSSDSYDAVLLGAVDPEIQGDLSIAMHRSPDTVASIMGFCAGQGLESTDSGLRQRCSPVGGSAYRMPKKELILETLQPRLIRELGKIAIP